MFWPIYSKLKKLLASVSNTGIDVDYHKSLQEYLMDGDNFQSIGGNNTFVLTNVWIYTLMYMSRWSAGEMWINNNNMTNLGCAANDRTDYGEIVKNLVSRPTFIERIEFKNNGNFYSYIIYKPNMG